MRRVKLLPALQRTTALVNLFPANASSFDALHAAILAAIPDGPQKTAGIVWGEFVANQILAARANDGSNAIVAPPGGSGPGVWVPTPPAFLPYLLPQWGFVVPFAMSSSSQFRPPGPPSLDSQRYAADYKEVKELGAAVGSTRTEEQTEIALFWADGAGTETPPGHWNSIAQIIADAQGNTLEENARLFAFLNIAMADAAICAWDARYTFHFWRPVTAIAFAEPELNWMSFIMTPPFPDYVSGHSTFSGCSRNRAPTVLWHGRSAVHNRLRFSARRVPQLFNMPRRSGGSGSKQDIRGHSLPIGKRRWLASGHQRNCLKPSSLNKIRILSMETPICRIFKTSTIILLFSSLNFFPTALNRSAEDLCPAKENSCLSSKESSKADFFILSDIISFSITMLIWVVSILS